MPHSLRTLWTAKGSRVAETLVFIQRAMTQESPISSPATMAYSGWKNPWFSMAQSG